jgi:hypothetical protein
MINNVINFFFFFKSPCKVNEPFHGAGNKKKGAKTTPFFGNIGPTGHLKPLGRNNILI